MATKTRLGWQKLFLILTVLPCCRSLEVSIPQQEYKVSKGEDITLTCSFIPAISDFRLLVLKWSYFQDNPDKPTQRVATFYTGNPIDIVPEYEGRVILEVDVAKRVSTLRLTKVTMQESNLFQCSVMIPGDDVGRPSATTSLLVLEPPSRPLCTIQGEAEYWQDITLTCKSEEGSPKPSYKWNSYSVKNMPRQFPPKTTEVNGLLSLFNISQDTSGFFICTSTNEVASASCNLTLAVVPASMKIGSTAGIIGGVIAGLLCLVLIIFCCCRKKGQKEQNAEGSPEDMEFHDKDAPEVGEQYRDDTSEAKPQVYQDKAVSQNSYSAGPAGHKSEDDQHSYYSGKERPDVKGSDIDTRYQEDQRDSYHGSRDRLDDKRDRYGGSRDHLDDQRDRYGGSRDRLEDQRDQYGGSRDRLDDNRNYNSRSRDRLDDQRDRYGGSRDRLDDKRDQYGGSRDRLDDKRDHYGGSRDRLDDNRDRYGGSRDRLDDNRVRYGGSRDRLDDQPNRHGGSRDHLDYNQY
ncbi:V-set and immunoglobulin domain-containing protein 1-like [Scomber scombrus]